MGWCGDTAEEADDEPASTDPLHHGHRCAVWPCSARPGYRPGPRRSRISHLVEGDTTVKNEQHSDEKCPACGYCPHCGRRDAAPVVPMPVYPRPWSPYY